jgi:protein-disulfide isomerase
MSPALYQPVGTNDHVRGRIDAPLTLVEYGDFECPYCGMAYPIVKQVEEELGDELRVVFRHFPLKEQHPHALHAAQAAEAAAEQGRFWKMHDVIFEHQNALEDQDLIGYARDIGIDAVPVARALEDARHEKIVRDHFRGGVKSGVNGTPTFFINGTRFDGEWSSPAALIAALRSAGMAIRAST